MYHFVAILFVVTILPICSAQPRCNYTFDCMGYYRSCCNKQCSERRFCSDYCSSDSDCTILEYCVYSKCSISKPVGYCDYDNECGSQERCTFKKCTPYCDCTINQRCKNGKCVEKESPTSFSTSSIVGFTAVVVVGSCIACVVYCGCARRAGQAPSQSHRQQTANATHRVSIPNEAGTHQEEDHSNAPIHPGGPPPYESLEMLNRTEEVSPPPSYPPDDLPPPPSYQEALRNSHNNLNQS